MVDLPHLPPNGFPCRHYGHRQAIGPYPGRGRKNFMVTVDQCSTCGFIYNVVSKVGWREYDWIQRSNRRKEWRPPEGHDWHWQVAGVIYP